MRTGPPSLLLGVTAKMHYTIEFVIVVSNSQAGDQLCCQIDCAVR
jgi:hypothetical protein